MLLEETITKIWMMHMIVGILDTLEIYPEVVDVEEVMNLTLNREVEIPTRYFVKYFPESWNVCVALCKHYGDTREFIPIQ